MEVFMVPFTLHDIVAGMFEIIQRHPGTQDVWKTKAGYVCDFSEHVAEELLNRLGFKDENSDDDGYDIYHANLIAKQVDPPHEAPPDCFTSLWLLNVRADLTEPADADPPIAHEFAFGDGRVISFTKKKRIERVMSYEEAARFIILWLMEKLLQIMRKNHWDRIDKLPDLFDRLAAFTTE